MTPLDEAKAHLVSGRLEKAQWLVDRHGDPGSLDWDLVRFKLLTAMRMVPRATAELRNRIADWQRDSEQPSSRVNWTVSPSGATLGAMADALQPLAYLDWAYERPDYGTFFPAIFGLDDSLVLPIAEWTPLTPGADLLARDIAINADIAWHRFQEGGPLRSAPAANRDCCADRIALVGDTDNYFHFVVDYLPKLILFRHLRLELIGYRYGLGTNMAAHFGEAAGILGIEPEDVTWLPAGHPHELKKALFINSIGGGGNPHRIVFRALRLFASRFQGPADGPKRLFISRADAGRRRILNEEALYPGLKERGFEIVSLGGRSLTQQMTLFHNAQYIIGAHGAGLTNLLWSRDLRSVIELAQLTYGDGHFETLCRHAGVRHVRWRASEAETEQPNSFRSDFRVNAVTVLDILDRELEHR